MDVSLYGLFARNKDIILIMKRMLISKLSKIILYGSYARGDYRENSDVDVMLLV